MLIDGGLPSSAPLILDNILALGFDPTDIKILLNSHAHYDHAGGLAELQRVTGRAGRGDARERARSRARPARPGRPTVRHRAVDATSGGGRNG